MNHSYLEIPEAPKLAGLRFRYFNADDYTPMADLMNQISLAEGSAADWTPQGLRNMEGFFAEFDPHIDRIMAEVDGKLIAVGRVQTGKTLENERLYFHSANVAQPFRGRGIELAMLRHHQRRLRQIAAKHPADAPRFFQGFGVKDDNLAMIQVLEADGYAPIRHSFEMLRPNLENIPHRPLPDGMEIRPICDRDLTKIWDAHEEAFSDHWGKIPAAPNAFQSWRDSPDWNRQLSRVAWEGEQCAGIVQIFIPGDHNNTAAKKRAYTEAICVRRPWRRKGVASALIASCLHALKEAGFDEAALGVDTQNLSGALRIYETMGYQVKARYSTYRRDFY